jgi:uncharacterized membrane protein YgcG
MKNFLFLLFFYSYSLLAQINIPEFQGNILDETNTLSLEQKNLLHQQIQSLRDDNHVWLAVYIASSLQGITIEELAHQVFNKWKLGQEKVDNGLLFIIVPSERKMRLEVGYGLEPYLTDAWTRLAQERIVKPAIKENKYSDGLTNLISAIKGKMSSEENDFSSMVDDSLWGQIKYEFKELSIFHIIILSLAGLFFLLLILLLLKSLLKSIFLNIKKFILAFTHPNPWEIRIRYLFYIVLNFYLQYQLYSSYSLLINEFKNFSQPGLIIAAFIVFYLGFHLSYFIWQYAFKKFMQIKEFKIPKSWRLRIRYLAYLYLNSRYLYWIFQDDTSSSFFKESELPNFLYPVVIFLTLLIYNQIIWFIFILIAPTVEERVNRKLMFGQSSGGSFGGSRSSSSSSRSSSSSSSSSSSRSSSGGGRSGGGGSSSSW